MTFEAIYDSLLSTLGEKSALRAEEKALQPTLCIAKEYIADLAAALKAMGFDHLACLTGIDLPSKEESIKHMEVVYHFCCIPRSFLLVVKIQTSAPLGSLPSVPTLSHLWKGAEWLERETYDLLGIGFEGHPDLRRILMPADWEGYPLRKGEALPETYHGIKVKYE